MSKLIKSRRIVEDDWIKVDAETAVPGEGNVIVGIDRWRRDRDQLKGRNGGIGVRLGPADDVGAVADDLDRFSVVALTFETFKDGRAYSQARMLRQRHGYAGELRATGDVLRDQLYYMERCGFDAFELADNKDPDDALRAFSEFSITYQAAADETRPIYRRGRA